MRLLFAGYRRLHLEYLFIYLFICGDLLQSLGPLSTKTPSYGYFSYYLIVKRSDDITKFNLWNYGICWQIQKEQLKMKNVPFLKISQLVQIGGKI